MLRVIDSLEDVPRIPNPEPQKEDAEDRESLDENDLSTDEEDINELIARATRQLKRKRGAADPVKSDDVENHQERKRPVRVSSRLDPGISELAKPLRSTIISSGESTAVMSLDAEIALEMDAETRDKDALKATGKRKKTQGNSNIDSQETTAGSNWFDLKTPELTPELKRDLQLLKMRGVLDPKRFFKRDDKKGKDLPKHFQIATIVDSPHEFYSSRLTAQERKKTLVEEVMADVDRRKWYKKKFNEVQQKTTSGGKLWYKRKTEKRKPPEQRS
ncbi:hypothetical protein HDU93_006724 [Gonapodya sp. JEL0774]|nr:hypothetical protein HDU93_006724 [Gonapodya sp. JEL0774]